MTIYTVQTRLIAAIKAELPQVTVMDNILPPLPSAFPFVAVDPASAIPELYAGGTQPLGRFTFDIYIAVSLAAHGGDLAAAREQLASMAELVLTIQRLYASSVIFGEDVVGAVRASIALIKCSFPI